ncbi:hypothetical protein ACF07Y_42870 [Streptomyces sp. NPDC016566]
MVDTARSLSVVDVLTVVAPDGVITRLVIGPVGFSEIQPPARHGEPPTA